MRLIRVLTKIGALCAVSLLAPLTTAMPATTDEGIARSADAYTSRADLHSPAVSYNNTLIEQRADPHILKHTDGWYYFTATVPAYDQVILRRAETIEGLRDAAEVVIFQRRESGHGSGQVWAPELHAIDGKWYVYVALGVTGEWRIRATVLEGTGSDNPLEAEWTDRGIVPTNWDEFSLDMSTFEAGGVRYLVWAQHDPTWGDTNTGLFLAPAINPWTPELPAIAITYPDLPWERIGHNVNEGAYVIKRNGTIFLTYSASATDHNYCVGLLTAPEDADLMDPSVWTKSQEPVFVSNSATGQWGPGHNSFTVSEDGLSDLMVFHDRGYRDIVGDPLNDPNRRTRVQKLYWRADGTPDFGIPVPDGLTPVRLRSAVAEGGPLYVRGTGVGEDVVAEANVALVEETQFRIVSPGLAGGSESVSLESTTLPGSYLRRSGEQLVLATAEDIDSFNEEATFVREAGLSDEAGVAFASLGSPEVYVKVSDGVLVTGPVTGEETVLATFFLE